MDLGWSQDEWTDFFEKFGPFMSIYWSLFDHVLLLEGNEVVVKVEDDPDNQLAYWELDGIRLGKNTDSFGRIHCAISALYGGTTVSLYRDSGRTYPDLVGQGTRVGSGEVTIVELNDSGLSGRVYLGAVAANSDIYLNIYQGVLAQIGNLVEQDRFDAQAKAALLSGLPSITSCYTNAMAWAKDMAKTILLRSFLPNKLLTAEISSIGHVETQASDGTVTVTNYGIGSFLIDAMRDQSAPAGAQAVREITNIIVNDTADSDNHGSGSLNWAYYDHIYPGTITYECVTGGLGSEKFEVSIRNENGVRTIGNFRLMVDKIYRSVSLGIEQSILSRIVTEVAGSDPENLFSTYWAQGISSANSDGGRIYLRYTKGANVLSAYSDAARTILVAQATGVVAPGVVFLAEEDDSGLAMHLTWTGVDPVGDPYDFAAGASEFMVGDKFFSEVSSDWRYGERTRIFSFFARLFGILLPSGDDVAATIKDGIGDRGFQRRRETGYSV